MCPLGHNKPEGKDPHVFSNLDLLKLPNIMVVGQNPGWNEVLQGTPFVGEAGRNFDKELEKGSVDRSSLYITNIVKCHTPGNAKPDDNNINMCKSYLNLEIGIIKPKFIATLGSVAFKTLCPDMNYNDNIGKLVNSTVFPYKIFAILHPSPLNLADPARRKKFVKCMNYFTRMVQYIITPF